jgi:DNA-binding CsgD family transcriptional regulator/PAS domain-containing protein
MKDEDFYALISSLHEGVVDDSQWMAALDQLSDAFGGAAIFLGSTHRDGTVFELSGHRVDPQWIDMVNGQLSGHDANPIFSTVSGALRSDPIGTVLRPIVLSRVIEPEDYHRSPIYKQAIAPAGHEFVMVIVLHADQSSALSLTLARPREIGDFGNAEERLATAVGPHLLSVLRLRHQFAIARSSTLLLDRFDRAVLLVSSKGKIVSGNVRAQRLLDRRDGLLNLSDEVRAAFPEDTDRLRQAVQETDRAARGASLHPRATVRLPRPSGRPDLVVRASPVAPSVASSFGAGELATVALFVHDPEEIAAAVEDLIAEGLGLSRAEAAVAARIWEGDSVGDAARELMISPNTVKTHLKVVFEKAGVDRQSALVRKIAMMVSAVADD